GSHAQARGVREHLGDARGRGRTHRGPLTRVAQRTETNRGSQMTTASSNLDVVRRIATEIAGPAADSVDREGRFPSEAVDAMKKARLLGVLVPKDLGGEGTGMIELASMCEILGQACSSAAMVFAMHQIQVACIVRHALTQPFYKAYLGELVEK